uniref:Uncharacterized protein n=1 Tax=Eptatretus burgeri TaxID=7764 RepID=A0A8C4WUV8_EPTBU
MLSVFGNLEIWTKSWLGGNRLCFEAQSKSLKDPSHLLFLMTVWGKRGSHQTLEFEKGRQTQGLNERVKVSRKPDILGGNPTSLRHSMIITSPTNFTNLTTTHFPPASLNGSRYFWYRTLKAGNLRSWIFVSNTIRTNYLNKYYSIENIVKKKPHFCF